MWPSWRRSSVPEAVNSGEGRAAAPVRPILWKRIVVDILAVYPTLMLILTLSDPWLGGLPREAHVFIIVCLLALLMAWPVMPLMQRIFGAWLAPR